MAVLFAPRLAASGPDGLTANPSSPPESLRRDDLVARLPLAADQTARIDEIARGEEASINFWQLREAMPAHLHRAHEEVIVVLEGTVEATIGTRRVSLGPGDSLLVPRDTIHAGRVTGESPARGYSVFAPPFDGRDQVPAAGASSAEDRP